MNWIRFEDGDGPLALGERPWMPIPVGSQVLIEGVSFRVVGHRYVVLRYQDCVVDVVIVERVV